MTDDQTPRPQFDEQHVPPAEGWDLAADLRAENANDPTPVGSRGFVDETFEEVWDHSAWMRPPVGDDRATAEIVGALAPEPAPVNGRAPMVDVAADPANTDHPGSAALLGARAALRRGEKSGARLLDEAEQAAPLGKRLLPWLVGAMVLALLAFAIGLVVTRKPKVVATDDASASASVAELVQVSDLLTAKDVTALSPKGAWRESGTLDRLTATSPKLACLGSTQGQPNTVGTRQRTVSTTKGAGIVTLHQIDGFASVTDARKAYSMRAQQLAACSDQPALVEKAAKVTGIGDEATSLTIAFQERVTQHDTVLLVRTGNTIHTFDAAQANGQAPAATLAQVAAGPVNHQCARSGGACAKAPRAVDTLPPVAGVPGWLITSDLPRITPGAGLWTGTDSTAITTKGSGCENITLASVAGPTKREQRSFLISQDNAAPTVYGLDEVLFTFPNDAAARAFAATLQSNISSCAKRTPTAKVSEPGRISSKVGGVALSGATNLVTQSMGGSQAARFRTGVAVAGKHVAYLVNNPGASYDMGSPAFQAVTTRAAARASQAA